MTQPTHAQIEAAAKTMFDAEQLARSEPRTESDCRVLARLALTAAAEAGEQREPDEMCLRVGHKWVQSEIIATIERCAQAIKDHPNMTDRAKEQAIAAIRAMKDQP